MKFYVAQCCKKLFAVGYYNLDGSWENYTYFNENFWAEQYCERANELVDTITALLLEEQEEERKRQHHTNKTEHQIKSSSHTQRMVQLNKQHQQHHQPRSDAATPTDWQKITSTCVSLLCQSPFMDLMQFRLSLPQSHCLKQPRSDRRLPHHH